jgi:cell division protein FtsL
LWSAAILATAVAFVAHLTLRFENVRIGYELGEARREQRELAAAQRLLALEAATLTEPERVEALARKSLRMNVAEAAQVVSQRSAP